MTRPALKLVDANLCGSSRVIEETRRALPAAPEVRGYHAVYRRDEVNHCPGCGRTHWHVGRVLSECAFCGTALVIERVGS